MFGASGFFFDLLALSLLVLPIYWLIRSDAARDWVLVVVGVFMIRLIAIRILLFYAAFWLVVLLGILLVRRARGVHRSILFWAFVAVALSPMVIWKLWPEPFRLHLNYWINHGLWVTIPHLAEFDSLSFIVVPIGLSFMVFRAIDILAQVHLEMAPPMRLRTFLRFAFFAPVVPVGPICQFQELQKRYANEGEHPRAHALAHGLFRVVVGLLKLYALAQPLSFTTLHLTEFDLRGQADLLLCMLLYGWYWYFNFSGYSDIAIGIARIYGFRLKANFDNPLLKGSLQQFWGSWHMSLTRFAQRWVFVPLGGYRPKRQWFAILATMMTIALWHGLSFSWVAFGVYHGVGMLATRWWQVRRQQRRVPSPAGWRRIAGVVATYVYVSISLPIVVLPWHALDDFYLKVVGV